MGITVMKTITKKQFRNIILKNKISLKSMHKMTKTDFLKSFFLKKPYFHLIWKQCEPLFHNMDDVAFIRFVNFCNNCGFDVEYHGNKSSYALKFLEYIIGRYYVVDTDTQEICNAKINQLWDVFKNISDRVEYDLRDHGISFITKILGALIEQTNLKIEGV